jgi:hypothetical protein
VARVPKMLNGDRLDFTIRYLFPVSISTLTAVNYQFRLLATSSD